MNPFQAGKVKKAVTFSYDDGVVQDVKMVDLMAKYGIKATFNINSELLGQGGFLRFPDACLCHYKVKPEDVRDIYQGHEVAVHTLTHPALTEQTDDEVIRQVEQDRLNLSELVGYEVTGMAYPGGLYDDRVVSLLRDKTGVRYSRTIDNNGSFDVQSNLYQLQPTVFHQDYDKMFALAEEFLSMKAEKPQIFYIWGHAYEQDIGNDKWTRLEEFFKLISGHDDIFYGTNKEVLLPEKG